MIILLNGPPNAGKDTAAKIIGQKLPNCRDYKISKPIKDSVAGLLGIDTQIRKDAEENADEVGRIVPDYTYRELQIGMYEDFVLKYFDKDFLGIVAVRKLRNIVAKHITVSDAGLTVEVKAILQGFTKAGVCLLEIDRPGKTFKGDIRQWIDSDLEFIHRDTINNEHDLELFELQIERVLRKWKLLKDG